MDLNEELIGKYCYLTLDNAPDESPDVHCSLGDVIKLLKVVYNQAIQDAYQTTHKNGKDEFDDYTNKLEAILKLKK